MPAPRAKPNLDHPTLKFVKEAFGDRKLRATEFRGQSTLIVEPGDLHRVMKVLRTHDQTSYDFLSDIVGIDYMNYPATTLGRFGVVYILVSTSRDDRFYVKVFLDPSLPGRERIFAERNWHGTEAHMRVVRGNRYKLILNGFPERQFPITGNYPRMGAWRELLRLKQQGELTRAQARLFEYPRPAVEFYDIQKDPHELNNLAYDLAYRKQIDAYISELRAWQAKTGDHAPYEKPILPDLLDRKTGLRLQRKMTHAQWPRGE